MNDTALLQYDTSPSNVKPRSVSINQRPEVRGKFLYLGDEKLLVRGVTYGTFAPNERGEHIHDREQTERDFAHMAANGINAVRVYTVPERWVLDTAARHGLRVMVGLPWEQHLTFLDRSELARDIERRVRDAVAACAGHPAVLCYAIGNEIPATIVRWHGARRIERFLARLTQIVRAEDPGALVTYVNFPTTEYLDLPFLDFLCFNVYLEQQERLEAYLARLQNLAAERPLIMAELGLDSMRNGEEAQSASLAWQLRSIFAAGCAGSFVFAWTDEWYRGGYAIEDWDFGLTRRDRTPKPALDAVKEVYAKAPFPDEIAWPRISVVVCAYNAEPTIRECLDALRRVTYPNFEPIVIDDGSTDRTATIASDFPVRLISTPNRGLSNARNSGMEMATGEIVAYLDSDAYPDKHWLHYLAHAFLTSDRVGIGGPNLAPPNLPAHAECFDLAPGGPVHVLLDDRTAEHIPGCNMAFRKANLQAIDGFDPNLRIAGDDVDICWRLQERGWTLGYAPGALVWHHRRTTVASYWKQQRGYGRAEALLEKKWPTKYNTFGHITWGGRIYAKHAVEALGLRPQRIYQGVWGSAPFQHAVEPTPGTLSWVTEMPEWYFLVGLSASLSALGAFWKPLRWSTLALGSTIAVPVGKAVRAGWSAQLSPEQRTPSEILRLRALISFLHFVQPLARLRGRLEFGLTPLRFPASLQSLAIRPRQDALWSERWRGPSEWLESVAINIASQGNIAMTGGELDDWDLQISPGVLGSARTVLALEEHGAGRQVARLRTTPRLSSLAVGLTAGFAALAAAAGIKKAWLPCGILAAAGAAIALRGIAESGAATESFAQAVHSLEGEPCA